MLDFLKSFIPRAVQDVITAGAGYLVAHGFIAADQEQSTIGSAFFLAMLAINYAISHSRKSDAAMAGAAAVGGAITPETANAIAKGKTP